MVAHMPGFSSLPPHLICRIVAQEFVDIPELPLEVWRIDSAARGELIRLAAITQKGPSKWW